MSQQLPAMIASIGNKSTDGVFAFRLGEKKFLYTNSVFNHLFQLDPGINPGIDDILPLVLSEDHDYLHARFNELVQKGALNAAEFRMRHTDQSQAHFSCDVFMDDDNQTIIGFVKNITRIKEHENYMVEYMSKKDAFLDMITHNLSGPLHLTKNLLDWIQKSIATNDTKSIQMLLGLLQENTSQCINIVNDFLQAEHIESQRIYVHKTRFNAVEKINALVEQLSEMNPGKIFVFEARNDDVNIITDSVKFFQVIHNLLSNALKFTPREGMVTITIKEEPTAFVFVVSDNGIGIPEDFKKDLLTRRGVTGREGLNGEKSNGIGLFVVKKLVELLDGEVWFESEENKGSSFFVRLSKE